MDYNSNTTYEIHEKLKEYGKFISQTLQPRLQSAVDARDAVEAEVAEYSLLRNKLQYLENNVNMNASGSNNNPTPVETIIDISCETIFCKAIIPNPRTVYVNVGLGFNVEFTLEEAIMFIGKRLKYLEDEVLEHRSSEAERVAKDVEKALELLEELGGDLSGMDET